MKKLTLLTCVSLIYFCPVAQAAKGQLVCDGKGNCQTEEEYQAYLNSPDYHCRYYAKYIWKESEREYGKKQYAYTEEKLLRIKELKDEGVALCAAGERQAGEAKMLEAIRIISITAPAR